MTETEFQKELTRIGGQILDGRPILKVVNGTTEKIFACGRIIPKYRTGRVFKDEEKRFRLRHLLTNEVKDCTYGEAKDCWERSHKYDLTNDYLPETYHSITLTLEPRAGFFVEQYFPPDKIKDTPANWEANRYQMWYDEEKRMSVMTDIIGPFPSQGRYEAFYEPKRLDHEALETIEKVWRARDQWEHRSQELTVKDIFVAARERDERELARVTDMVKSDLDPHRHRLFASDDGLPTVYMNSGNPEKANKLTKHGRAR